MIIEPCVRCGCEDLHESEVMQSEWDTDAYIIVTCRQCGYKWQEFV